MGAHNYDTLIGHVGHDIECTTYGDNDENVAIECKTCNVVLLDFDKNV